MPNLLFALTVLASLTSWKEQIEKLGTRLVVAQVYTETARNELRLPADTPDRPQAAALLSNPAVVEQFVKAHALTVHSPGRSIVLVNMAREVEFEGHKEELIAHEMGHVWLQAKGFRAPPAPAPNCAMIHVTDMVQHVMIREELDRRDIPHRPWLEASVAQALPHIAEGRGDVCQELQKLALWVDLDLGLTGPESAQRRPELLAPFRRAFPGLEPFEADLARYLKKADLSTPHLYQAALREVLVRLQKLPR